MFIFDWQIIGNDIQIFNYVHIRLAEILCVLWEECALWDGHYGHSTMFILLLVSLLFTTSGICVLSGTDITDIQPCSYYY